MEKIDFIIPKNESKNIVKIEDSKNSNKINVNPKSGDYIKIAPNVFTFNNSNVVLKNDIYLLYNNACNLKKTDIPSAIYMFYKCEQLINNNTKDGVKYEIFINLSLLLSENNGSCEEIEKYYKKAINIFSDRAEPYYYWALYCNKKQMFEKSYDLLKNALSLKYVDAVIKYPETQQTAYDKYLYDEISVTCYWLKKYSEAKKFIEKIIDDPDFSSCRERLLNNLKCINEGLENN